MAGSDDLINFDVIESQKENIQSLPGGRSAKKLAALYSPTAGGLAGVSSSGSASSSGSRRSERLKAQLTPTPSPGTTRTLHEAIRAKFEEEVASLSEADDPLDVYDRYVRWTLEAYPTAQATAESQLHVLLERATRAFVGAAQYRNDPRYLRLWLHYIRLFSDAPREAFVYLARHGIGENLALFYEEYAAWLETAGRWIQADEVLRLGIDRAARPEARLLRKYAEFEQRRTAANEDDPDTPGSPALPTGWQSIGSLAERKKENTVAAKPWAGEKMSAGGKKVTSKMPIFKDAVTVNPQSGKKERVFVDLRAVYPTPEVPGSELSFEEIWAANRGLLHRLWDAPPAGPSAVDLLADVAPAKLVIHRDAVVLDENGAPVKTQDRENRPRKKKATEMNETQIIKAKLDSPSGRKMKKRGSISEPTMTMHTRAATDDIYDIFNQPLRPAMGIEESDTNETSDEDYESDADYTSGAESTGTTRQVSTSDAGDDEVADEVDDGVDGVEGEKEADDAKSVSEWSDFTARKDIPDLDEEDDLGRDPVADENDENDDADESLSPLPVRRRSQTASSGDAPSIPSSPLMSPVKDSGPSPPKTRTVFIPIPPEDYVAPTRPYRDPVEVANNRLPFMTPITERTESSLAFDSDDNRRALLTKTPSKAFGMATRLPSTDEDDEDEEEEEEEEYRGGSSVGMASEAMSSPLINVTDDDNLIQLSPAKLPAPLFQRPAGPNKGPIIKDLQCNPIDESIRSEILAQMHPPLSSYAGFYDHSEEKYEKGGDIRRYAKAVSKSKAGNGSSGSSDRTSGAGLPVMIMFPDCPSQYTLRRELGAGAFAPVYLVENMHPDGDEQAGAISQMGRDVFGNSQVQRHSLEALKMETPPTVWEFHMMRLARTRLGPQHRVTASLAPGLECHLYRDETFLFLPYYPHGTLLDVVNLFRAEPTGVMDETLAMFFAIELFRTVEGLHSHGLLHGDIKADNCLLRLDESEQHQHQHASLSGQWHADGTEGWGSRGVTLIDFGRAIDMRSFAADVRFVADWKTTAQDCAEMREGRPWTWHIDYHGLAGTLHTLLFGKYMETVRCDQGTGATVRRYRIRESLKRYWQTDLWSEAFDVLLNPAGHVMDEEGARLPVLRSMRGVRDRMETWLAANCERGVGLKSLMVKVEGWARGRK
ncbi:checkpoint protein kinase [Grosmannia clavigera kw1407]|uniref:Checkpoint protein kinase n=1 Tax=Grosmannia clavigera (strain kw1407 / UAMH 11150) TaxID=655863 RepID=F0X9D2_GROCL|nr:checkpoint protein kinase [Grosmannia clavigera kw1407]EFX05909.1 checkpoint protein kinase [Grosmannia clavigera kw1407]